MKKSLLVHVLSRLFIVPTICSMIILFPQDGKCVASADELTSLSLEQLMDIEITSVSKKKEKASRAPAAVFVITQEDIHRSGATSIAEVLRLSPGLQVARISSNEWAITSRGFNGEFANKLLVLIDGRSVYSPLFSGVFWDVQDVVLEDIDRIEIIRGPGATLWGANAVNGIINIITKKSTETQGVLLTTGGGIIEKAFGSIRYGGKINDKAHYRAYFKYFSRDNFNIPSSENSDNGWDMKRGGFRTDWSPDTDNDLSLQGDIYDGNINQKYTTFSLVDPLTSSVTSDGTVSGGNLIGKWSHEFSDDSNMSLQLYYDRTELNKFVLKESRDTYDIDFQHLFSLFEIHELTWGFGYRLSCDDIKNPSFLVFDPDSRNDQLLNTFIQDEITLLENTKLTIGSKFEHNDYSGFEIQPNARLLWIPSDKHTLWTAVSRAVRTPSRFEHDIAASLGSFRGEGGVITLPTAIGDKNFESEDLLAFEAGYRNMALNHVSADITAFYNVYNNLRTFDLQQPFINTTPSPHLILPLHLSNNMDGEAYGVEIANQLELTDWWRLTGSYSFFILQLHSTAFNQGLINSESGEDTSPEHQFQLHSYLNLPHQFTFDTAWYFVDELESFKIPSYHRVDVRLAWYPNQNTEISFVVQNIFEDDHSEFGPEILTTPTNVERVIYLKFTFTY